MHLDYPPWKNEDFIRPWKKRPCGQVSPMKQGWERQWDNMRNLIIYIYDYIRIYIYTHNCSREWGQRDSGHSCCATRKYNLLTLLFFSEAHENLPCFELRPSVASVHILEVCINQPSIWQVWTAKGRQGTKITTRLLGCSFKDLETIMA